MEFEDQDEEHEEEVEDDNEEEEEEEDGIPISGYDPLLLNSSSSVRPLKMSTETRSSSSSSPPPSPLSLSIPPLINKPSASYRECQKNHAVGIGRHAVDGCGEFMPAGAEDSIDSLKCAACNCHRNFHRKEADPTPNQSVAPIAYYQQQQQLPQGHPMFQFQSYSRTSPVGGYEHQHQHQQLALPSSEMMMMASMGLGNSSGKKRFRTKFTAEQKEKMLELAEKIGWRLQKQHEEVIQHFCHHTGLKRKVLKVWMHNNKQTYLGKKP